MRFATLYPSEYIMRIKNIHLDKKLRLYIENNVNMYPNNIF